jgi:hypothetical protein
MVWYLLLVAHLCGDYVLQSHVMAQRKTQSWRWAMLHALFYGAPFAVLLGAFGTLGDVAGWAALATIIGTHAVIDRLGLARRWCAWYGVGFPGLWANSSTFEAPPPFLGVWLIILVDNTAHLLINGLCVAWALNHAEIAVGVSGT